MTFQIVECDNCRHGLYVEPGDVRENCKLLHSVCPVCYMPLATPNPYYKEAK